MERYDYVIAGAGSAGCVLAARLSEDPGTRVLLLEAGGRDRHPNIKIPAAFAKQFKTKLDWDFDTDPELACDNRALYIPRGKALGGSSSMNAMLYVRGAAADYDAWRDEAGCDGWGWDDVLPAFRRSEDNARGASPAHGAGGPLHVNDARSPRRLTRDFVAAAEADGIPFTEDYNAGDPSGASYVQVTQHNGRRWSAADAFLKPALKRPNLTVLTGAHVTRVELEGGRATGVAYTTGRGEATVAKANREVILAAGAIGSPQLLMLSGIGPAEHLRRHGIEPVVERDAVGAGLQDHPYALTVFDVPAGSLYEAEHPRYLAEWILRRSGPLTSTVAEAFAFVRSQAELEAPDLQFHFAPAYFVDNGFEEYDGHAITYGPVLVAPKARGEVRLRSGDPEAKPHIRGNFLAPPEDLAALVAGIRLSLKLAQTEPLRSQVRQPLLAPENDSDEAIEAFIRRTVQLLYHPACTCAMGGDEDAVLDPQLRVRGVDGLRVADASVMPTIVRGNTNAPTIMIAEKAAELIRGGAPAAAREPVATAT